MKIFTQKEVADKIALFNEMMMEEKKLQEELLGLDMSGRKDRVRSKLERHDEILQEIDKLRTEKMLPILEELAKFVAYCEKVEKGEIKLGEPFPGEDEPVELPKAEA